MNINRFEELLLTHGPSLSRWPATCQETAAALVNDSTQAQALLREAQQLHDEQHAAVFVPGQGGALTGKILAYVTDHAQTGIPVIPPRWRMAFGTLAASAILLGFFTGLNVPAENLLNSESSNILTGLFVQPSDLDELL